MSNKDKIEQDERNVLMVLMPLVVFSIIGFMATLYGIFHAIKSLIE